MRSVTWTNRCASTIARWRSRKVHATRDEAYCLYGIGVNYYALGDRQRAREFLERSLAIRTVALDGRGRMASLRALATIDAEQGRVEQALAADREALELAIAPSALRASRFNRPPTPPRPAARRRPSGCSTRCWHRGR